MSNERPVSTRLRYVRAKDPTDIEMYLGQISRVQIYGAPVWDGTAWFLWYVPNDLGPDIPSIDLDNL